MGRNTSSRAQRVVRARTIGPALAGLAHFLSSACSRPAQGFGQGVKDFAEADRALDRRKDARRAGEEVQSVDQDGGYPSSGADRARDRR